MPRDPHPHIATPVSDGDLAARRVLTGPDPVTVDVSLTVARHWREPPDTETLTVTYGTAETPSGPVLTATVAEARFSLDDPIRLMPVMIPKPWGREIWFTGLEARGESRVAGTQGELGLGSYLALAPERLCRRQPLVLLKMLDPKPEPVLGELYLEVHEEKREVYVVTAIDPAAWPDGRGRVRFGVNQDLRAELDDAGFRQAFLAAAAHYEAVRRAVDDGAADLAAEEQAAREATRAFTAERTLIPGDVVRVPTRVPHSLQHGVRVVEFQTPTYERLILTSTQRVLTQSGWDSARAIERMHLEPPPEAELEPVGPGVDRIVAFEDFGVWRARLAGRRVLVLPESLPYAVAFCISGEVRLSGPASSLTLAAEQAAFVPARAVAEPIRPHGEALLLVAAPGL